MFISHQFFNVCTLAFFVSTVGHVTDTGNTCTCFHWSTFTKWLYYCLSRRCVCVWDDPCEQRTHLRSGDSEAAQTRSSASWWSDKLQKPAREWIWWRAARSKLHFIRQDFTFSCVSLSLSQSPGCVFSAVLFLLLVIIIIITPPTTGTSYSAHAHRCLRAQVTRAARETPLKQWVQFVRMSM